MNILDLFAGCGGLALGFKEQDFKTIGFLEWEKPCIETLKANFNQHCGDNAFIHADIRNSSTYIDGEIYSLNQLIKNSGKLDGVIGGPPCQAYSLAGRIRDPNGMKDDYRNFLFEAYCDVLSFTDPDFFVFENVLGMLSAKPNGVNIAEEVQNSFHEHGYDCGNIGRENVYNFSDFGGPQHRKRVIIFGVNKRINASEEKVAKFHDFMSRSKRSFRTVRDAIGDLRAIYPLDPAERKARFSHSNDSNDWMHHSRYHNDRDIEIFRMLAEDAKSPTPKFNSIDELKKLYRKMVERDSAVHKYYVLREDQPSNLIPAHLHKDGLRHIHPDPQQARSITPREAARLQSFPDDFQFVGSRSDVYKMIGNAVPPKFASQIALAVKHAMN